MYGIVALVFLIAAIGVGRLFKKQSAIILAEDKELALPAGGPYRGYCESAAAEDLVLPKPIAPLEIPPPHFPSRDAHLWHLVKLDEQRHNPRPAPPGNGTPIND